MTPLQQKRAALKILKAGLQRIEKKWIKNRLNDGRGGVCALGALNAAAHQLDIVESAPKSLAEKALQEQIPHGYGSIPGFNDRYSTTKQDVISIFKQAIKCGQEAVRPRKRAQ